MCVCDCIPGDLRNRLFKLGALQGRHATTIFLEGFLEGSYRKCFSEGFLEAPCKGFNRDRGS